MRCLHFCLENLMSRVLSITIALSLISLTAASALGPMGQSVAINITKATTTQLVGPSGSTQSYVTGWDVLASATTNIGLEYGTKTTTPRDAGPVALTGVYNFSAQWGTSR